MSRRREEKRIITAGRRSSSTENKKKCERTDLIEYLNESLIANTAKRSSRKNSNNDLHSSIPHRNILDVSKVSSKTKLPDALTADHETLRKEPPRRRQAHTSKMQRDLIDFLEGSEVDLLERIPLETGGGEPATDTTSESFTVKKMSSVKSVTSDLSVGKKKKAPTDLCDIKALISELKASPSFTFHYLIFAVPQWSNFYTPYCLKIVPYNQIDKKNFFTISTEGVTHNFEGQMIFTTLKEWERDYNIYCKLVQIKTFSNFIMWKSFYVWHKNIAWHKVMSARVALSKALLYLNPILGRAVLDVTELCWKISRISFLDLSVIEKNKLEDFCSNQRSLKSKLEVRLMEFRELVKEIVNTACHGALLVVGYTTDDSNLKVPDHIVGTIAMRGIKTSRDGRYRMTYADQALKKKTCCRLAGFIQLVDFIVQTVFHTMLRTTLTELQNVLQQHKKHLPSEEVIRAADLTTVLEEPRSSPPKFPLFVTDLMISPEQLQLSPSCLEFQDAFENLMKECENVVLNIPVFLSDFFFDPFTEPMVCGKQEERLCGLGPSLDYVIKEDSEIQSMKQNIAQCLMDNFDSVRVYMEHFESLHTFYVEDLSTDTSIITNETDLEKLREFLVKYHSEQDFINGVIDCQAMGILFLQISGFKDETLPIPTNLLEIVQETCPRIGRERITALMEEAEYAYDYLEMEPKSTQHFVQYLDFLDAITTRVDEMDNELEYCKDLYDLIEEYQIGVSPDDINAYFTFGDKLTSLHNIVDQLQNERNKIVEKFNEQISKDISALIEEVANIREEASQSWLIDIETNPELAQTTLGQLFEQLSECLKKAANFKENQKKFKVEVTRFDILDEVVADVKLRQLLWESIETWERYMDEWFHNEFSSLSPEELGQTTARFMKNVVQFEKGLPENLIVPKLREKVERMKDKLPVITTMRNPNLKPRHWMAIEHVLSTKFSPDVSVTLEMLEKLGVFAVPNELQEISGQASSEASLEALLFKVEEAWRALELIVLPHKESKDVFIMGSTEEVQTTLDESNININTIASSRHVGPIKPRVDDWTKQLDLFAKTLDAWSECQTNWLYLESIFSAPDIQRQLPIESKMFLQVDKSWKEIMRRTAKNPLALPACTYPGLLETFQINNNLLDQILKCLEAYLETKRVAFPRFYFLSNEELLEILAQTRNPHAVQPHLRKCFDAIAKLQFGTKQVLPEGAVEGDENVELETVLTSDIIAMISPENEVVSLGKGLRARGNVEDWLGKVEEAMFLCLRREMKEALIDYTKRPRTDWVLYHPCQITCTVAQTMWCKHVHKALESGDPDDLKSLEQECFADLNDLAIMVRGDLAKLTRLMLKSLITLDVHARDIVTDLVEKNTSSSGSFDWLKQLRYYWQKDIDNCVARMSNASYIYGYEYLGAAERLVITPLTDKCFLCLMGALQLDLGGAPAGPAGTGKTESTKDLAKSLAVQCIVFNCSEGLDYKMMGRFFSGLAQSGAWCCFDEFNRIDIEVLSVIAQQLITIRNAKAAKLSRFMFEGREIKLVKTCAAFITMNPGYAGRTELPDNLKSLFRPMAMMVPDYGLIAEVMLYSEGFESSKNLAKKMTRMYKLCSEQLSQQDHYDFGMRAVKSVLVMAGALKRENIDKPENVVLIRALRDSNLPKFLKDDAQLFQGILNDLFPGVVLPEQDYGVMHVVMNDVILGRGLQPEPCTFTKVTQLYETMQVRHGVMTVGPTGGGKTTVLNVLKDTLTQLHARGVDGPYYRPVNVYTMNPKSVTMGELYGEVNLLTMEWKDGLLGIFVRIAVRSTEEEHQWVVCDGPVDAVWIENMNTVLDDNKMLCLANSERIKLTAWVHMVFEVMDLAQASPATVSRCGMVYVDPNELKWLPYVNSWLLGIQDRTPIQSEYVPFILELFTRYVENGFVFVKKQCVCPINQVEISKVTMMCSLFESLIREPGLLEKTLDRSRSRSIICQTFLFSYIWSVGGNLVDASREKFEIFVHDQFDDNPDAQLPSGCDLWDLYLNFSQRRLEPWVRIIPTFKYDPQTPFFEMLVPTIDTVRFGYIMEKLLAISHPVLFTGITGVGKSVVAKSVLSKLGVSGSWVTATLNFSAQTSSARTQEILESKLERKKKTLLGAPAGKKFVFFVDDVNMPKLETYGAQPPIELLRQYLDFKGLYDRDKMFWKDIQDVVISAACAPPGGGRNPLTPRFVRHFAILLIPSPTEMTLKVIFKSIMCGFLSTFSRSISDLGELLVAASVEIYNRVSVDLLPTPAKSHYVFNLRDLSKCVQGMLQADASSMRESNDMLRLFYHECLRVFHDRLVNLEDKTYFYHLMREVCQRIFGTPVIMLPETVPIREPPVLLFGDFMSQAAKEDRPYDEIKDIDKLKGVLQDYLMDFNLLTSKEMKLIFFMDAIEHICRLARLLRAERGNGLLVGVGGMGKQSLTKMGAHLNGYRCSQIELTSSYDYNSFHEDLRKMCFAAGAQNQDTVFLFTDTQIVVEEFLEDINNILNSGEVPNLFESDEYEKVIIACRPAAKEAGVNEANRDGIFDFFVSKVRNKLHLVICMSPVGDSFRRRCRMFPSLVNCCTIDWFVDWPKEALISVAQDALKEIIKKDMVENMASMCYTIHQSVGDMTVRYYEEMRRHYYVTPSSYLELLKQYKNLLDRKTKQTTQMRDRIQNGLTKLYETNSLVSTMKVELVDMEPQLKVKSEATAKLMKNLIKEKAQADEVRQVVVADEAVVKAKAAEMQGLADEAQADLDLALPAMEAAAKALESLNKADINELRVFNKPPHLVKFVMEAVCLLLGVKTDWASAKQVLGDVNFLKKLQEYDKDHISDAMLKKLKDYIEHPEFVPDVVATQSKVCRSMCMWVRAIDSYAITFRIVDPKRKKVQAAEKELGEVMAVLRQKQQNLAEVEAQIAKLEATYDASVAEKASLEAKMAQCSARLGRAGRLTMALGDEQVRWEQSVKDLGKALVNLVGDVLVAAACMAYLGAFTSLYREELTTVWIKQLTELHIPASPQFSLIAVLADPYEIRMWNSCGLPRDNVSTENAILVTQAGRWPLMIDPQEQANQWIRQMEANNSLKIVKLTDANYIRVLEAGIRIGMPVLIEEVGEILDPTLGPIMLKQTFIQGGRLMIRLGDADVEYDSNFRLYVTTKLANPHYLPEICIQVTLINFTVTLSGLEDQLLADVVRLERPDLESQRTELIVRINNDKGQLKAIEDKILRLLFASEGNILDDEELIETLNESKETSAIIGARVIEAEATEEKISTAREKYRTVANRGSILYFVVADLANIDPMYQFSLKYFNQIFNSVIVSSPPATELSERLRILIDEITLAIYTNVSRGLFERHKLVFSFMLCTSIFRGAGIITDSEWSFLLRGAITGSAADQPKKPNIPNLTDNQWSCVLFLSQNFPAFQQLQHECTNKMVVTVGDFEQAIELDPKKGKVSSVNWNEKLTDFEKMMLLKAVKEEKLVFAITQYVKTQLGKAFVESPLVNLPLLYQDTSNVTPLVFVLSTGSDPVGAFLRFAAETGNRDRVQSISLGQGQGPIAEKMIDTGKKRGDWVFLQNCHLASSWMLEMERIILRIQENPRDVHTDFRLFLSSMPSNRFPVSVLQNSVKVTNEPPKGLRANMKRAFNEITEEFFEDHALYGKWRKMIFGLCLFHAVIQERKKFGPLGWNIMYEFNDSDRECALLNLQLFCSDSYKIPWDALEYTTGEVTYGGRVTDEWDQRTLKTILKGFFSPKTLEEGYKYSVSGTYYSPNFITLAEFRDFIEKLPLIEEPEIFGLHENANIAFQTKETAGVIVTIMEVQPRESGGTEGKSSDEIAFELADMIKERIITKIDPDDAHPTLLRFDSRGSLPSLSTVLFQEVDRFNRMLRAIHTSLKELQLAIKGLVVMSEQLEEVYTSFLNNQVPKLWAKTAYPSLKTLGSWIRDLELRLDFISMWVKWGQPNSFWLSGFFFPQGFMTGCLQTHARKYNTAIDELVVDFNDPLKLFIDQEDVERVHKELGKEDAQAYHDLQPPHDGVLVHGLFIDAGFFDIRVGLLVDPRPGEINPPLPVMQLLPVTKQDTKRLRYNSPLYKTSVRAGVLSTTGQSTNYVVTVPLPSRLPESHWVLRGTALLTQLTD